MPTACKEQVIAAFVAKIAAISSISPLTVEREWEDDVTDKELTFIGVYEGPETPHADVTGEDGWTQTVIVEGVAEGAAPVAAAQAANALRAEIDRVLFADITLGGLVRDIRYNPEPQPELLKVVAAQSTRGFALAYDIEYGTKEGDPYTFA